MSWKLLHDGLVRLLNLERRIDPFFRPAADALLRSPVASLAQAWLRATRARPPATPAFESQVAGEDEYLESIITSMAAYMNAQYQPGSYQRAGNTKTHGVVRGRFIVKSDLPAKLRHGVFATAREYRAWVRFAGPGPASPPTSTMSVC
ncbi:hypothetical protein [Sinorhizobium prairiense]|uniref:hypothetical protein n=1 Tax=unclassified Sinorhizobium TaxID=2613772 RepID=UPI0023D8A0E2|nr:MULTISPECIES: hypothetical protein [unclassified Sinorhizobium]WEJ08453.1 hypothetical protein N0Q90_01810 [Sinorhizobium sp. M103]WEJ35643.1 hypothetical protein N0R80_00900 [Sinorhizobium sp. C101]